jgi:hypothetical protein
MKKYKIVKTVYLDFITSQDQVTLKYNVGVVEWDEKNTAWYVAPTGEKEETINTGNLIQKYIDDERLVEIM